MVQQPPTGGAGAPQAFRQVESYLREAERQLEWAPDPATGALLRAVRALAALTQRLAAQGAGSGDTTPKGDTAPLSAGYDAPFDAETEAFLGARERGEVVPEREDVRRPQD